MAANPRRLVGGQVQGPDLVSGPVLLVLEPREHDHLSAQDDGREGLAILGDVVDGAGVREGSQRPPSGMFREASGGAGIAGMPVTLRKDGVDAETPRGTASPRVLWSGAGWATSATLVEDMRLTFYLVRQDIFFRLQLL